MPRLPSRTYFPRFSSRSKKSIVRIVRFARVGDVTAGIAFQRFRLFCRREQFVGANIRHDGVRGSGKEEQGTRRDFVRVGQRVNVAHHRFHRGRIRHFARLAPCHREALLTFGKQFAPIAARRPQHGRADALIKPREHTAINPAERNPDAPDAPGVEVVTGGEVVQAPAQISDGYRGGATRFVEAHVGNRLAFRQGAFAVCGKVNGKRCVAAPR